MDLRLRLIRRICDVEEAAGAQHLMLLLLRNTSLTFACLSRDVGFIWLRLILLQVLQLVGVGLDDGQFADDGRLADD